VRQNVSKTTLARLASKPRPAASVGGRIFESKQHYEAASRGVGNCAPTLQTFQKVAK